MNYSFLIYLLKIKMLQLYNDYKCFIYTVLTNENISNILTIFDKK